jgi:hypothetical protein
LSPEEALVQSVCQYAGLDYEDQLSKKMIEIEELMNTLRKEVLNGYYLYKAKKGSYLFHLEAIIITFMSMILEALSYNFPLDFL